MSGQTIYTWRNQDQVDRGERPGVTSTEQAELANARRRITELCEALSFKDWGTYSDHCPIVATFES